MACRCPFAPTTRLWKCQGKFHNGIETRKGTIAGPHFFHQDAAVPAAKNMHHSFCQYRFGKQLGCLPDLFLLFFTVSSISADFCK
jgi:hypothetical protein